MGHRVQAGQGKKGQQAHTFDQLGSRWPLARGLAEANHKWRDHHDADPIGKEPCPPGLSERAGDMEQCDGRGAPNSGGSRREAGSSEKAGDPTDVIKSEWPAKPPLKQPSYEGGFTSIAEAAKDRSRYVSVAEQIGANRADDHTNQDTSVGALAREDQDARGDAGRGPKDGHSGGLTEQDQPEPSRQEVDEGRSARGDDTVYPPARCSGRCR